MAASAYREILRTPGVGVLMATATVARMPLGFETLAIVLLVQSVTGSFATAGLAAAAAFTVQGATAAPIGRLVDRYGQPRVLIPTAVWNGTAAIVIAIAGQAEASGPVLIALAALLGISPPVSSCQRVIFSELFSGERLQSSYAVDAVIQELVFTLGPLIATVAVALANPPAALIVAAAFTLCGTLGFTRTRLARTWTPRPRGGSPAAAIRTPAIRVLCVAGALIAIGFGAFEVAVTAFSEEAGHRDRAGVFLAIWAVGSAVGGLVYGARGRSAPPNRQLGRLALACGLGFLPAVGAPGLLWLAPAAFVAGLAIAPVASVVYTLTGEMAPAGAVTEAFAWLSVAFPAGFGAGAAAAGVIADGPGARVALACAAIGPAIAAGVALRWRGTLAPRGAGRS